MIRRNGRIYLENGYTFTNKACFFGLSYITVIACDFKITHQKYPHVNVFNSNMSATF